MKTTEKFYRQLNADLAAEFDLFALEHPDWLIKNIPDRAIIVLQTDDQEFNAWARKIADRNRRSDKVRRPMVLIEIQKLRPPRSRIVRATARRIPARAQR